MSTAAHSSGALHGKDWSVMVSPWCMWHDLSMGVGCLPVESGNLKSQISLATFVYETCMWWCPGWWKSGHRDCSSKRLILQGERPLPAYRKNIVHKNEESLPRKAKNISVPTFDLPKSLSVLTFMLCFHYQTYPRHFTIFIILYQWGDSVLWLWFIYELTDCGVLVACSCKGWWMWKYNLLPKEDIKKLNLSRELEDSLSAFSWELNGVQALSCLRSWSLPLANSSMCSCPT